MPPRDRGRGLRRGRHTARPPSRRSSGSTAWTARTLSTSGLNVRAELNWQDGRGQTVTGYLASSTLTVRIRELSASSQVLAAAVAAGGDAVRLNGLDPRLRRLLRPSKPGPGRPPGRTPAPPPSTTPPSREPGWAGSCPSPSTPVSRRRSPWRRCSGKWPWTHSPSRPASRGSPPPSASSGNCSTDCPVIAGAVVSRRRRRPPPARAPDDRLGLVGCAGRELEIRRRRQRSAHDDGERRRHLGGRQRGGTAPGRKLRVLVGDVDKASPGART